MGNSTAAPVLFLTDDALRRGFDLLIISYRHYRDGMDDELRGAGLTQAHHRALYFIHQNADISPSKLCRILNISKQSLGPILRDLLSNGYVKATSSERDGRIKCYKLTENGIELEWRLYATAEERMREAYAIAGPKAVEGFWLVGEALCHPS